MATRTEMWAKLGQTNPVVEPILDAVYKAEEEQIWREDLFSSPHGSHWHTSFHASSFPGDDPKACGRKAIYSLMNIPGKEPVNRAGRAVMEAGKAVEEQIVWRLYRSGRLLTDSPDSEHQMGFTDEEHWLTGSPDAVVESTKGRPHPVEIKSKDGKVVQEMQMGQRTYDAPHRIQTLTYLGAVAERSQLLWPELNKTTHGSLIYVSRDRPDQTHEYLFEYNKDFMEQGKAVLKEWKQNYLDEILPPRNKDWRWTEPPCKWCPVKRYCKADTKLEKDLKTPLKLSESSAIAHAEEVRGKYDYQEVRKAVLDRWNSGGDDNE